MSKAAVPPTGFSATPPAPPVAAPRPARRASPAMKVLTALASLRLTVVLFLLAFALIFCGTWAQREAGIWTVVNQYFRSFFVWIPFDIFRPSPTWHIPLSFPFPGGWLIGSLLLVNILAAHLVRFKLSWKRSGILILHAGLVVMMLSEVITGHFGVEGMMTIPANGSSNYVDERDFVELAVVAPIDAKTDDVVVVPGRLLRVGGVIHNDLLPFDVEVVRYLPNSDLPQRVAPGTENPATTGEGLHTVPVPRAEGNGIDPDQKFDIPSAYVTFKKKDSGESLGTYLVSLWLPLENRPPQKVTVDGKAYEVELRFKRTYKPYTVRLLKFTHDVYTGTGIPKDFRSEVRLSDPARATEREVEIYMNHPLRYGGETFYQAGFLPDDTGTILQVVRNPGWLLPYVSCVMVAVGMLIHFGLNLVAFLRRVVS
jgi:hypothetical protein